jgi:hypothetical protein
MLDGVRVGVKCGLLDGLREKVIHGPNHLKGREVGERWGHLRKGKKYMN